MKASLVAARARQFLESAQDSALKGRRDAAFEEARTAAELAAKAIMLARTGEFPRDHNVSGPLFQHGLVPSAVDPRRLSHLLRQYTRGNYGFEEPVSDEELAEALSLAERMCAAAP